MSTVRTFLKNAGDSYILLITGVAFTTPLIAASVLLNLMGTELPWTTWFYAVTVALGYYCLPLILVVSAVFLLTAPLRRWAIAAGATLVTLFLIYLVLDALVYRIMKFHIDPFWIEFAIKDHASIGLTSLTWLVVLTIVAGIVALEIGIFALARRTPMRRMAGVFLLIAVSAFAYSQIVHVVAYESNNQSITMITPHFPLYLPITSHKNASTYREIMPWVDAEAAVASTEGDSGTLRYPLADLKFDVVPDKTPPNIMLILLESWRFDCMDDTVSPNMYALGRKSSVFLNHLSSGNQTTCGIFGLFYGLHPTYWTEVKANSTLIDNPVLIDALKERGYAFGIFAKSKFERHKIKDTVFNGIPVHESFKGKSNAEEDADLNRQMIHFIEEQVEHDRPFFAFAFYKSTHAPYEYPPEYEVFSGAKETMMGFTNSDTDPFPRFQKYRNAVHYLDSLVDQLVDHLEALGQMDNTVIIITTDHGESFNDNGSNYWGHGSNYTQYQTRVPLIFYAPDREPALIEKRTCHIDIVPTLLREYLGCTSDTGDYSNGRDLFDDMPDARPLAIGSYVNHAFVFGDDVYEIYPMRTKKYKLFDVTADAGWPESEKLQTLTDELRWFSGY